ncbi:MAG: acetate--CoA ligase family protein [Nitrospiraceae bacterium]|nr:acetate--CoA ligase family protein [Nitrospiraceae bacterium]
MAEVRKELETLLSLAPGKKILLERELKPFLKGLGLNVPKGIFIKGKKKLVIRSISLRFPLVVKAITRDFRSKTEADAIITCIGNLEQLNSAAHRLTDVKGAEGVLIEEMVQGGIEAAIGGAIDPQFGPVVMFGLGGFFIELAKDVAFAPAPVDEAGAMKLAYSIKAADALKGIRGKPPVSEAALSRAIVTVSEIISTGLLSEITLNPVSLFHDKTVVLDAKAVRGLS